MTTTQQATIPNERELWAAGSSVSNSEFISFGRVIDKRTLMKGGNVFVSPFRAGVGVRDTLELDKIALMIVRGFVDVMEEGYGDDPEGEFQKFDLVFSAEQEADLIIDGYILNLEQSSKWTRKIGIDHKKLEVEGSLKDWQTGETIVVFNDARKTKNKEDNLKDMARTMGRNIAKYLINEARE